MTVNSRVLLTLIPSLEMSVKTQLIAVTLSAVRAVAKSLALDKKTLTKLIVPETIISMR